DLLSPLSDELLVRILSFLPLKHLLAVSPVSRRFYHLAGDSQLWKALYYARFVLPRAMRIPGFRDGPVAGAAGHKLHYSGRRALWADGRRGGLVRDEDTTARAERNDEDGAIPCAPRQEGVLQKTETVNWKRQYKLRYNWSRGKCAVEELRIGPADAGHGDEEERKILAKVLEGIAITADRTSGLRAWDLRGRQLLAQVELGQDSENEAAPSCIAIDDAKMGEGILDITVGFVDGGFGVWTLHIAEKRIARRYRHEKSSNGELIAMAFSYPYLLTATGSVLVSLYTFEVPIATDADGRADATDHTAETEVGGNNSGSQGQKEASVDKLVSPYLLTSLNSHTSRPPLALSIRKTTMTTVASIAYTFSTRQGWSIGIQDLHIRSSAAKPKSAPEITTTRIAYTTPVDTGGPLRTADASPRTPRRHASYQSPESRSSSVHTTPESDTEPGPTTLCYTHPYLLATLPDNTLVLHMCTSDASSLSISRGIRLWGHTSGISDAEITARGKAVSVSSRGEEMRVWELEGRSNGLGSRSIEIRPGQSPKKNMTDESGATYDWDERRNWVGFDDEMVIVLKEKTGGGKESLMVYDFT
ncbi:hypothetical protein B0T14DRAFT_388539, partial [Immersiella caudata]